MSKSIYLLIVFFNLSNFAFAQVSAQTFSINLNAIKIADVPYSKNFFNASRIGINYSRKLIKYLEGNVSLSFLQSAEKNGGDSSILPLNRALNRYISSYLTFEIGSRFNFISTSSHTTYFGFGASIRHRNEVEAWLAAETERGILVQDKYVSTVDWGGYFEVGYSYKTKRDVILGINTYMQTYNLGSSVFGIGISIGKLFDNK